MRNKLVVCLAFLLACAGSWQLTSAVRAFATPLAPPPSDVESPGALRAVGPDGAPKGNCPLEHTDVKAEINGFLARVNVEQKFANPFDETIEAVYTFPLPHRAAVDRMTMRIGDRTIEVTAGTVVPPGAGMVRIAVAYTGESPMVTTSSTLPSSSSR